ncbi:SigE family RNA polymerase sigma factor [Nocardioides yefusunii]|uniref:SigE family RNA polymerase sigma factor n=1 Tax=Nocardioides yefusunii TaxID=2500546 RepID=A0ABW1QW67_9ACTN|nr:SigE family RNA polymerase sigma factor [Nocardioides yefusunii]
MATPEEFTEFVAARYSALVRTARFLVADAHAAEDLVQDALVKCVGAWPRINGDPEGYVRTVMVRTNISRWRRVRLREHAVEHLPEVSISDPDVAEADALRRALATLPPKQRTVVVLRHVEDRTEREVAELLGCSLGTVKSQCHAGLAKLREALAEPVPSPV